MGLLVIPAMTEDPSLRIDHGPDVQIEGRNELDESNLLYENSLIFCLKVFEYNK